MMPTSTPRSPSRCPRRTAERMKNGSTSAGQRDDEERRSTIWRRRARRHRRLACAYATTTTTSNASRRTSAGTRPPVNNAAIETPVTEPMVISTRLGGIVSAIAPEAASSATSSPALLAAPFHLGKQHRRDRRHVGGLRAGDAGHQIHRPEQHVLTGRRGRGRPAWRGSRPSRAPCRCISISRPSNTNSGTASRIRLDIAFVHPVPTTTQRDGRGQREIGQRGDPEGEPIGTPIATAPPRMTTKNTAG